MYLFLVTLNTPENVISLKNVLTISVSIPLQSNLSSSLVSTLTILIVLINKNLFSCKSSSSISYTVALSVSVKWLLVKIGIQQCQAPRTGILFLIRFDSEQEQDV